jgi:hypothetical protein
MIKAFLPKL